MPRKRNCNAKVSRSFPACSTATPATICGHGCGAPPRRASGAACRPSCLGARSQRQQCAGLQPASISIRCSAGLIQHPAGDRAGDARCWAPEFLISNFTANIAPPGLAVDAAAFRPGDRRAGALGSSLGAQHHLVPDRRPRARTAPRSSCPAATACADRAEVPADPDAPACARSRPPAGSIIAMDGPASGTPPAPTSPRTRTGRCCSATTPAPFLRPQVNQNVTLSAADPGAALDPQMRTLARP